MRDLLGSAEVLVRILKDFHASSVLLERRDVWSVDSSVAWWSGVMVLGVWSWGFGGCRDDGCSTLFRAKIDGCRKE